MSSPLHELTLGADARPARVLVFDSGVGALSVCERLARRLPSASLLFASDNAGHPYGAMDERALVARVVGLLGGWCERHAPDAVVVACNTASTAALPALRARLRAPVVGVVPAIKPAARLSTSGVVTLLATPATIGRAYTGRLIADHAAGATVFRLASMALVGIAERKLRGTAAPKSALAKILSPLTQDPVAARSDVVVLGCTHFHWLRSELAGACPRPLRWIDPIEAVCRRTAAVLAEAPRRASAAPGERRALFTDPRGASALSARLNAMGFVH